MNQKFWVFSFILSNNLPKIEKKTICILDVLLVGCLQGTSFITQFLNESAQSNYKIGEYAQY